MKNTVELRLTIAELRVVMAALQELPFRVSAPVIGSINGQIKTGTDAEKLTELKAA